MGVRRLHARRDRAGDLRPGRPTAVRVCLRTGMSGTSTDLDVDAASGIIAALRALARHPGPGHLPADRQASRPPPVLGRC